jgi:hypothetical protein
MTAPATDPITWQILQAVGGLFAHVSVANGFYTNASVIYDNFTLDENDLTVDPTSGEQNAVFRVIEIVTATTRNGEGSRDVLIDIAVECYIKANSDNAQLNAHRVRADVIKCIPGKVAGLKVYNLKINARNILGRATGSNSIVVQVLLQAAMMERTAINTNP